MGKRKAITDARARAFKAPPGREAVLWDGVVSGLGLRALPSGRKTWFVHRRVGDGFVKRTLSVTDAMSVEDARRAARALIAEAECGGGAVVSVPTMLTFGPAFLADCAERWKPTTRMGHAHNMERCILPAFGNRRVDAIAARDVRNWFDELSVTRAATANRSLAVLSSLMKHAEDLGLFDRRADSTPVNTRHAPPRWRWSRTRRAAAGPFLRLLPARRLRGSHRSMSSVARPHGSRPRTQRP